MNGTCSSAKRGFTLVEMLVVVAIMSIVATATVNAIRGAQRQARAAKCQANMHSLYRAVAAYRADTEHFPTASGYEYYEPRNNQYIHFRGWVNWVLTTKGAHSRRKDGNKYSASGHNISETAKTSQAASYTYAGTGANGDTDAVSRSIDEGAIFVYADKNHSIYCCDEFKRRYGSQSLRSYAMNQRFGSHRWRAWPLSGVSDSSLGHNISANRMAMFVEMGWLVDNNGKKRKNNGTEKNFDNDFGKTLAKGARGQEGGDYEENKSNVYSDDSVWDWDSSSGKGSNGNNGENIGAMHMKSGKCYGHVIFADGHLESIALDTKGLSEQRKDLGSGGEID